MSYRCVWKRILISTVFVTAFVSASFSSMGYISMAEGEQRCPDRDNGSCFWRWGEASTSQSDWYVKMEGGVGLKRNNLIGEPSLEYGCKIKLNNLPDIKFCELQYHDYDKRYGQIATFKLNDSVFQVKAIEILATLFRKSRLWSVVKAGCGKIEKCDRAVESLKSARISYRTYAIPPYVKSRGHVICEKTDSFTWIDGRKIVDKYRLDCGEAYQLKGDFFGRT